MFEHYLHFSMFVSLALNLTDVLYKFKHDVQNRKYFTIQLFNVHRVD